MSPTWSTKMKDVVWKYCKLNEKKEGYVQCNLCKGFVSIGGNRKTQSIALFKRHLGKHHAQLYKDLYKEPDVAEEKSDGTPKKRKAEEEAEDPNTPCTDKARSKKARQTLFQKTIPQVVQEKEPLPFHSTRAQEIHKALAE